MARRPSIAIRAKVNGEHPFFAPAWNRNGTLKPGYAKGHQEPFAEYAYYVRWSENGRRKTQRVGPDAAMAVMIAKQRQSGGLSRYPETAANSGKPRTIHFALTSWVDWAKAHKDPDTYDSYKRTAELFLEFCAKDGIVRLDQISEERLLDYKLSLERHPQRYAEATRWKFLNQLHGCLRRAKCFIWLSKDDMPKKDVGARYAEYPSEHIKLMLERGCTELGDWEFIALIGMAGVRRDEIVHCEKGDFDFRTNEVSVRAKGCRPRHLLARIESVDSEVLYVSFQHPRLGCRDHVFWCSLSCFDCFREASAVPINDRVCGNLRSVCARNDHFHPPKQTDHRDVNVATGTG